MKKPDTPIMVFIVVTAFFLLIILLALLGQKRQADTEWLSATDPLLIEAKQQAAATFDTFRVLYQRFPARSYVRFRVLDRKNNERHVWGRVVNWEGEAIQVTDIDASGSGTSRKYPNFLYLSIGQIEDWLVETGNDSVRGGFTTQVLLVRKMQQYPSWQDSLYRQLGLFLDRLR